MNLQSGLDRDHSWTKGLPYGYGDLGNGATWETMKKGVDKYDEEMCRGWKEDLDTLLVFVRHVSVH